MPCIERRRRYVRLFAAMATATVGALLPLHIAPTVSAQEGPSPQLVAHLYLPFAERYYGSLPPSSTDPRTPTPQPTSPTEAPPAATVAPTDVVTVALRVIGVRNGDAMWLHTSDGFDALIDGGAKSAAGEVPTAIASLESIDVVIATHSDADHIGGLAEVIAEKQVGLFAHNGATATSATYRAMATTVAERAVPTAIWRRGDSQQWGCCVTVAVLHPDQTAGYESNDGSIVLRVTHDDVDFLLTGDIGEGVESQILHTVPTVASEVLKVAHHGSETSSSPEFLSAVRPELAIVTRSTNPALPAPSTIERLLGLPTQLWQVGVQGGVTVTSRGDRYVYRETAP